MRAERLVALLFTLQSKRAATVAELADALGVSVRTMHRDIASLQSAGVPLWTESGRHGGVRLVEGWRSRLDGLTTREAVAMFAMGAPRALAELGLGSAMAGAHAKVTATLPASLRDQAQQVAQRFHLDAPGWFRSPDRPDDLATLARAVWEQRRVRGRYQRPRDEAAGRERVLAPLGLVLKAGAWYLVALAGPTVRTYRVTRLRAVVLTDERFDRPTDFDLADWWAASAAEFEQSLSTLNVHVRLSPAGVRALPAVLDADVATRALRTSSPGADGWADVVLSLETDPVIAAGQLLALGTEVDILSPDSVRAAFADTALRMARRHGRSPG